MHEELEIAQLIWTQINDDTFFTDAPNINMYQRVSYILRKYHSDMVEEAPYFTNCVKEELKKIFKQNGL